MIGSATVALLPFCALVGTALGSFIWGVLADLYGRRATILLVSAVMFIGTSICGAMPSFNWNLLMCFLMGVSAGGMLPVAYALLAEIMPTRHRGWSLVVVGGVGTVGGYLAASGLSALLQPDFGWRIMWLLNLPSGLILIALSPLIPESARFLQQMGRVTEARQVLARFGVVMLSPLRDATAVETGRHTPLPPVDHGYRGTTVALTLAALARGFVNFWRAAVAAKRVGRRRAQRRTGQRDHREGSSVCRADGCDHRLSVQCLEYEVVARVSDRDNDRGSAGVAPARWRRARRFLNNPIVPLSCLIIGSTGVISILLPYAAENYPVRVRGRATGWVAGCSKVRFI